MDRADFSVVMPVHEGASVDQLDAALRSLADQTRRAYEVVVVEDGPLTVAHHATLDRYTSLPLVRVQLGHNQGVAVALQAGLTAASRPWIARMDADDLSEPLRFELQEAVLRHDDVDVLGAAMLEFDTTVDQVLGTRRLPERHDEIVRFMRRANPVNHPTAVFRRSLALEAGGYQRLDHLEDYDLFARMLRAGARFHNLPQPLVRFRGGTSMLRRRRSPGIVRSEIELQRRLVAYGVVSTPRAATNLVLRTAFRWLPMPLMRQAYRLIFLRRGGQES